MSVGAGRDEAERYRWPRVRGLPLQPCVPESAGYLGEQVLEPICLGPATVDLTHKDLWVFRSFLPTLDGVIDETSPWNLYT